MSIDVNQRLCKCGTCRDHMEKAAKLLVQISEADGGGHCPGSKMTIARLMVGMAGAEYGVAVMNTLGGKRSLENVAIAMAEAGRLASVLDEMSTSGEFVPFVESYLATVAVIATELHGPKDTSVADELLKNVRVKKG